ncbi:MAG: hypothetical protein WKG01_02235 [Kofleriaceae bacterium]
MSDDVVDPPPRCEAFPPTLADLRFAAGTTYLLEVPTLDGLELSSSDPAIVGIAPAATGEAFELTGGRAGAVTLTARCLESDRVVATAQVIAAPVASIELRYRAAPGANRPVVALAGLRGHADSVQVIYRGNGGELLRGRGQFAVRGTAVTMIESSPRRLSDSFFSRSTAVALEFAALGNAELVASVAGGIERVLPIEVVPAPATLELVTMVLDNWTLVPAPSPVATGTFVGIAVIAKTADGRYVSGVQATWNVTPAVSIVDGSLSQESGELVIAIGNPGPVAVTARAGTLTATREIIAQ